MFISFAVLTQELPADGETEGVEAVVGDEVLHLVDAVSAGVLGWGLVGFREREEGFGAERTTTPPTLQVPSVLQPKSRPAMLTPAYWTVPEVAALEVLTEVVAWAEVVGAAEEAALEVVGAAEETALVEVGLGEEAALVVGLAGAAALVVVAFAEVALAGVEEALAVGVAAAVLAPCRHWLYQSFCFWQLKPDAHSVSPE